MVDEDIAERIRADRDEARRDRDHRHQQLASSASADASETIPAPVPPSMRIASGLTWPIFVAVVLAVGLVVGLFTYGPVLNCYATGGEPVMNAVAAERCEKNGDGELSPGDRSLRWWTQPIWQNHPMGESDRDYHQAVSVAQQMISWKAVNLLSDEAAELLLEESNTLRAAAVARAGPEPSAAQRGFIDGFERAAHLIRHRNQPIEGDQSQGEETVLICMKCGAFPLDLEDCPNCHTTVFIHAAWI